MTPARRRKVAQKSLLHANPFSPSGGLTEHVTKMERLCLHRGLVGTGSGSQGRIAEECPLIPHWHWLEP